MKPEILAFSSAEELAAEAARCWMARLAATEDRAAGFKTALSGGRVAQPFLRGLADAAQRSHPRRMDEVDFFWADERCVPPDHPESNYKLAEHLLFRPLDLPAERLHRIQGERPPLEAAALASEELRRVAVKPDGETPVMDLVILGMGEDGHVASLFPGAGPEVERGDYIAVRASKPPPDRITLSYRVIQAAREVWVLVSGPGKGPVLQRAIETGRTDLPIGKVLAEREKTTIFSDVDFR